MNAVVHLCGMQGEAGIEVEEVEKDLDSLDEQAQREAVAADAPELGALLAELRANLAEVRTRVGPLVKEVRLQHSPPMRDTAVLPQC